MDKLDQIKKAFKESVPVKTHEPELTINGNISGSAIGNGNTIINTSSVIHKEKYVLKPGEDHISEAQACALKELIKKIYDIEQSTKKSPITMQRLWSSLNKYCGVTTYRAIKQEDFEKAKKYLQIRAGKLNSMPSAKKKNPNWRNQRYATIHVICKQNEIEDKKTAYINKNFCATSLTELNDDDLDKTYSYVTSLKSKVNCSKI